MINFFVVYIRDSVNNENIEFSRGSGSPTPFVILDDGWSPNITKYIRNGEQTWSDVVEELECMTNVATRDEALALLEKLNALIHRAARDIEEKQQYTVQFRVRSQFSTAQNEAFTHIISPPDDGNVITLSTDIQTAPPGQIKFKLRFKRTGAWITSFSNTTHSGTLTGVSNPPSGFWRLQTQLPTNITIPTPLSLSFSYTAGGTGGVKVESMFLCVNVVEIQSVKYFTTVAPFDMDPITYPSWRLAEGNFGYIIRDNTDSYSDDKRPYLYNISLTSGIYAVFVSWRSVQSNVVHRLQVQFDNNAETRNALLVANNTKPQYQYIGTVTMTTPANILYLRTTIGHSTGFELEKLLLVKLKATSNIINLSDWYFDNSDSLSIENSIVKPIKQIFTISSTAYEQLSSYDSVDIVADSQQCNFIVIAHSSDVFSLRTEDFYPVITLPTTITYRPIRTTFH